MVLGLVIGLLFLSLYGYGIILAVKLMRRGEWQWFALPFIAIPLGIVAKITETVFSDIPRLPPSQALAVFAVGVVWLIIVELVSGWAVCRLMRRYRKETKFVTFYAAQYFLCAALSLAVFLAAYQGHGIEFFSGLLGLLAIYGFIMGLVGIRVMHKRMKLLQFRAMLQQEQSRAAQQSEKQQS